MKKIRTRFNRLDLSALGILFALLFYIESLTPTFLPRTSLRQAVISGYVALTGYGIGCLLSYLQRNFKRTKLIKISQLPKAILIVITLMMAVLMTIIKTAWLRDQHAIFSTGIDNQPSALFVLAATPLFFILFLALARAIKAFVNWMAGHVHQRVAIISLASTTFVVFVAFFYGLYSTSTFLLGIWLEGKNDNIQTNLIQPQTELRSGSPASLADWEGLGRKGREFVATGPSSTEIGMFHIQISEPVRVYAGINNEASLTDRIELAINELKRTGAFEKSNLLIYTPSGTGWVNPAAVDSAEIILAGDLATVAVQYSAVSSFLQYLTDRDLAGEASTLLTQRIIEELDSLVPTNRPKLYIYGESLGSLGSQSYFAETANYDSFAGGQWVGSPASSSVWRQTVKANGPAVWNYVQSTDDILRFAFDPSGLNSIDWEPPRFAFIFNPSDPVVWFGLKDIFVEPEIFEAGTLPSLSPHIAWSPIITYEVMLSEMLSSSGYPSGLGHSYKLKASLGWIEVLQPEDWTNLETQRLLDYVVNK